MKSKGFFVAVVITLCLFLFGCESQLNNFPTTTEQPTNTEQPTTQPKEEPPWVDSCIHDDFIYYSLSEKAIARASIDNPNNMEIIVTQAQLETLPEEGGFPFNLEVYGNLLIFNDGHGSKNAYNLKTGELFRLLDDFSTMTIWNDMIYYVEHSTRSFSLFRKPLNKPNAQPELLLGTGDTRSVKELGEGDDTYTNVAHPWVRSVYVEDDRLFFTQNNDEVWEYKEDGKHVRIEP